MLYLRETIMSQKNLIPKDLIILFPMDTEQNRMNCFLWTQLLIS